MKVHTKSYVDLSDDLHYQLFGWSEELRVWRITRKDAQTLVGFLTEELDNMKKTDILVKEINNG